MYGPPVGPAKIPLVNGGFIFKKFFFRCYRCHLNGKISIMEVTPEELAILNKFSQDGNSFQTKILFPPSREVTNYAAKIYTQDPNRGISR